MNHFPGGGSNPILATIDKPLLRNASGVWCLSETFEYRVKNLAVPGSRRRYVLDSLRVFFDLDTTCRSKESLHIACADSDPAMQLLGEGLQPNFDLCV